MPRLPEESISYVNNVWDLDFWQSPIPFVHFSSRCSGVQTTNPFHPFLHLCWFAGYVCRDACLGDVEGPHQKGPTLKLKLEKGYTNQFVDQGPNKLAVCFADINFGGILGGWHSNAFSRFSVADIRVSAKHTVRVTRQSLERQASAPSSSKV